MQNTLNINQINELVIALQHRFEKNDYRHKGLDWSLVLKKLTINQEKLHTLYEMEQTGGEPDIIEYNLDENTFTFYDCSPQSPSGRRSLCYDYAAWEKRKEHKPVGNAIDKAKEIGAEILDLDKYCKLQSFGAVDTKTSSWIKTPDSIRELGGAIFAEYRYGQIFIYHNGAESYYAARGFRTFLTI